jgi:hypothetical protein
VRRVQDQVGLEIVQLTEAAQHTTERAGRFCQRTSTSVSPTSTHWEGAIPSSWAANGPVADGVYPSLRRVTMVPKGHPASAASSFDILAHDWSQHRVKLFEKYQTFNAPGHW